MNKQKMLINVTLVKKKGTVRCKNEMEFRYTNKFILYMQ